MFVRAMPKIFQRYIQNLIQLPKAKIYQRYATYMLGVIPRLQILDNYLKQRYAKDMPQVIPWLQSKDIPKVC